MCNKAFDTFPFAFGSVPDQYKTQKCGIKLSPKNPLSYSIDSYRTQEICYKSVDACLPALKFVPDWFVTKNKLEKLDDVVF